MLSTVPIAEKERTKPLKKRHVLGAFTDGIISSCRFSAISATNNDLRRDHSSGNDINGDISSDDDCNDNRAQETLKSNLKHIQDDNQLVFCNRGTAHDRNPTFPESSENSTRSLPGCFARTFPEKLKDMIAYSENENRASCDSGTGERSITWLTNGESFLIHDPVRFSDHILPIFFKQSKFSSFTRKLYRWGFRQIKKGPDSHAYFHKLFRKEEPTLSLKMRCNYSDREKLQRTAKIIANKQKNSRLAKVMNPELNDRRTKSSDSEGKHDFSVENSTSIEITHIQKGLGGKQLSLQKLHSWKQFVESSNIYPALPSVMSQYRRSMDLKHLMPLKEHAEFSRLQNQQRARVLLQTPLAIPPYPSLGGVGPVSQDNDPMIALAESLVREVRNNKVAEMNVHSSNLAQPLPLNSMFSSSSVAQHTVYHLPELIGRDNWPRFN